MVFPGRQFMVFNSHPPLPTQFPLQVLQNLDGNMT